MRKLMIITLLFLLISSYAYADIIYLKGGGKIEGRIIEKPEIPPKTIPPVYKIETPYRTRWVREEEISSIEYDKPELRDGNQRIRELEAEIKYKADLIRVSERVAAILEAYPISSKNRVENSYLHRELKSAIVQFNNIKVPTKAKKLHSHYGQYLAFLSKAFYYDRNYDRQLAAEFFRQAEKQLLIFGDFLKK